MDLALMFRYFSEVGLDVVVPALPEITWTRYADVVAGMPWEELLREG